MNRQTCIHKHVLQQRNPPLKSFLENEMRKLGANQKLKSGIFCVLESGICSGRIRNPASGIRNPQRGIQNLILSWITLHEANQKYKDVKKISKYTAGLRIGCRTAKLIKKWHGQIIDGLVFLHETENPEHEQFSQIINGLTRMSNRSANTKLV